MRKCRKCDTEKPEKDFPISGKNNYKRLDCKLCFNLYRRNLYRDNPHCKETYKKYRIKHGNITVKRNRQEIIKYFRSHPCVNCGETNPVILEFDHIKKKNFGISKKARTCSWHKILPEIKKCQVLCSNCHAIKTAVEQKWNDLQKIKSRKKRKNLPHLLKYLNSHPCVDCGDDNPIVLEFDHIRDKKYKISRLVGRASWKTVLDEIKKCEVRCSNCHQIKTSKQQGWYDNGAELIRPIPHKVGGPGGERSHVRKNYSRKELHASTNFNI